MKIFKRVQSLLSSSINDLLDKAENPRAMANQIIRDLEEATRELRANTASVIATTKLLDKKIAGVKRDKESWRENAEAALREGKDELAKEALVKVMALERDDLTLNNQHKDSERLSEKMRTELKAVESRLHEARAKRDTLLVKLQAATSRKKMHDSVDRVKTRLNDALDRTDSVLSGYDQFSNLEEQIEKQVAELEAREEIDDSHLVQEFERIKQEHQLEEELKALKEKVFVAHE